MPHNTHPCGIRSPFGAGQQAAHSERDRESQKCQVGAWVGAGTAA
jgi:hypothetical protein